MKTGALFDATRCYRYLLWREWNVDLPKVGFVMLNPNRADATLDDPTIRRCIRFARSWGYGGLEVVNLFAYCTAHPKNLRHVTDPIGADNDRIVQTLGQRVDQIVLAWGNWGTLHQRNQVVLKLLGCHSLACFGLTKQGQPCHPLYLKASLQPIQFVSTLRQKP
ncbi:MAG: DUF1643 domain-containing protein [Leptolyngbyaceae cyanobacterium bins.302]|nr:DUF1643 domain-containing protein [Leptolyngbyaceae cyanobacterium bins.302]